jgi:hypothetical protein
MDVVIRFRTLAVVAAALVCAAGAAAKSQRELTVRPGGARGPLVRYDLERGTKSFAFAPGMLSADATRFASIRGRTLTVSDVRSRIVLQRTRLPQGSFVEAVSKTGRSIVVRTGSQVRVITAGRVAHTLTLPTGFTVDAISPDSRWLYLIQHKDGEDYAVRQYVLATGTLKPRALVQKGEQEQMAGTPAGVLSSLDGTWQFTLYTNGEDRAAFVHALNLAQAYTICIDLPGHGSRAELSTYSLALGPEGRLYAANAALGVVASFNVPSFQRPFVRRFQGTGVPDRARAQVSVDGSTLAFSAGRKVWRVATPAGTVRTPVETRAEVVGLGFLGQRLYAAHAAGPLTALRP